MILAILYNNPQGRYFLLHTQLTVVNTFRKLSSFPILCRKWMRQLFLGSGLDLSEVQYYILLVILMGPEYSVYFCASAIQYVLSTRNRSNSDKNVLLCSLEEIMIPLQGFKAIEHLPYMKELELRYGEFISKDIRKGLNAVITNLSVTRNL